MTLDEFMHIHSQRLHSYISRFRKQFHLPHHLQEDLLQAATIAIWQQLPSWREYDAGKSVFNWCAMAIRRAMEETMRRHHGLKIRSMEPLPLESVSFEEAVIADRAYLSAEENLDLKRILTADKKPAHIVRFIATALSPASGADIARAHNISRQAVCLSVSQTRKRLRSALG